MTVSTRAVRRVLSLFTASALLAGLMIGTPSVARAAHDPNWYLTKSGVDYTGVAGCSAPDAVLDGEDDNVQVQALVDNVAFQSGDTLRFCSGTYNFSSQVYADLDVLNIAGVPDADRVTISGGDDTRLFEVNGDLNITSITLTHGYVSGGDMGGAALAETIDVISSTISDSYAGGGGGAIASYEAGAISVIMSDLLRNEANDMGGAVGTFGSVHVVGSELNDNVSHADDDCRGGGGAIASGGQVDVLDSTFSRNEATVDAEDLVNCYWNPLALLDPGTGRLGGLGGAIATIGRVEIEYGVFMNNYAEAGGGAVMAAGRAYDASCADVSTVVSSTFTRNSTNARLGRTPITDAYIDDVLFGGGALLGGTCSLSVSDSAFTDNSAMAVGGAIDATQLDVETSTFINNSVNGQVSRIPIELRPVGSMGGGAIAGIFVAVDGSTFISNQAPSGGAILNVGGCLLVEGSTFVRNQSTARGAGFGGGAVHALEICGATFLGNDFSYNSAAGDGGALWGGILGDVNPTVVKGLIQNPTWLVGNKISRNRAGNGGAIAFSFCPVAHLRYQTTKMQRWNRITGNAGGRNPMLAVISHNDCTLVE